jgi:hypothetical protein
MRKWGLAPATLITVVVTGFVLNAAGWFSSRPAMAARAAEVRTISRGGSLSSDTAARYHRGEATHWRAFVLHR